MGSPASDSRPLTNSKCSGLTWKVGDDVETESEGKGTGQTKKCGAGNITHTEYTTQIASLDNG